MLLWSRGTFSDSYCCRTRAHAHILPPHLSIWFFIYLFFAPTLAINFFLFVVGSFFCPTKCPLCDRHRRRRCFFSLFPFISNILPAPRTRECEKKKQQLAMICCCVCCCVLFFRRSSVKLIRRRLNKHTHRPSLACIHKRIVISLKKRLNY